MNHTLGFSPAPVLRTDKLPRRVSLQGPLRSALTTPDKAKVKEHFRV